jgi:hypothetical protein
MNRFKGLILSLAALLILSACVEQVPIQKQDPIRLFNREYYAVKKLTRADVRKMKRLMESSDVSASKTAGLILGRHYVRNGEVDKGYELLQKNLNDSYLDRFTKVLGHLWVYDAALKMNDNTVAANQYKYLEDIEMDDKAEKAFRLYCTQEVKVINDEDVKSCVISEAPEQETEIEIEIFEKPIDVRDGDEPVIIKDKLLINLTSAEADPALVEAMLYSISKLAVDIELDFTGEKTDYDFRIDADEKIIVSGNSVYSFGIDMKKSFREAVNLALLNGGFDLVLGYTEELYEEALEIAEKYKDDEDINIYMFNVEASDFQQQLRTIKEQAGEDVVLSFAVAGTEEQMVKIVPFLRFFSDRPDRTIISVAVKGFGKKFFGQEYIEYFRGSYVVTDVLLLGNKGVENFNEDFFNDFSRLPNVTDMLGYDLVVFLEKARNPAFLNEYLTGIRSLEEGKTVRNLEAYKIVSSRKIRKLIH